MKHTNLLIVWLVSLATVLQARSSIFDVDELPHGKNITLGRAAVIRLTRDARSLTLQATDTPQTLSFELEGPSSKNVMEDIGLFDTNKTRVQHIHLESGKTYLYTFSGLNSILVIPEPTPTRNKVTPNDTGILIKSDKPLTLSH